MLILSIELSAPSLSCAPLDLGSWLVATLGNRCVSCHGSYAGFQRTSFVAGGGLLRLNDQSGHGLMDVDDVSAMAYVVCGVTAEF